MSTIQVEVQCVASRISNNLVFETPLGGFVTDVLSEAGSSHNVFINR